MNKWLTGFFALVACASFATADEGPAPSAKDLNKAVDEVYYVETSAPGIVLSGYVDAGYIYNFNTPTQRPGTDSTRSGDFDVNAVKLALEKGFTENYDPKALGDEFQAGFRVDLMYGEDVASVGGTNGAGGLSDDFFLEQAYVQLLIPVGNGLTVKVGKFVTILGYEVIERPSNLNITYGNLFQNMIPLWHTGILAGYQVNDTVDVQFGVANGTNVDNGTGTTDADNIQLLASINVTNPGGNANLYQAVAYTVNGDNGLMGAGVTADSPTFIYDVWGNWAPKAFDDKLLLGFNADFGYAELDNSLNGGNNSTTWWGAALYAKYQFTDVFSLAGRADYIHNDDSVKFGNGGSQDTWSWTGTAGFDLLENLMLRAEYRVDFGDGVSTNGDTAHTIAAQVVYSF